MLTPSQIETFETFGLELCAAAASVAVPMFRNAQVTEINKDAHLNRFDPVTEADKGAEVVIRALIRQRFPDHGIIGEEFGEDRPDAEFVWVLDPIDGTRAFICGLPLWTTLIGLRHKGKQMLGFVAQPILGEVFLGSPNGSRLITANMTTPLKVRACASLADAVIGTTDPNLFLGVEAAGFGRLLNAVKLARYGCDAYAFAMVAAGYMDLALETGLKAWDIDAIIPLIENAGGCVTNWRGEAVGLAGGQVIAASSMTLVQEAVTYLQTAAV
jgi:histidinol phosphatase-like enzyme (inositol monophosphatase family)